ncbi:MAG: glycosyltransferase [Cyanobacteria bacterium J06581_3]
MRILSIHNAYKIRGGEDESRESEERLLREYGHTVDVYEESNDDIASYSAAQLAVKTVWSQASYRKVRKRIAAGGYDVVHIQNFFPLISPAAHYAAKAEGAAVVQTLRNYRLICPNALFFRSGNVCEDCVGKPVPYPGIIHGCYRESRVASTAVATMLVAHRLAQTWKNQVDVFIALTNFAKQKLVEGDLPKDKIMVKPNFLVSDPGVETKKEGYALFVGRLAVEKGLDTLIEAWKQLRTPYALKIVGDGPLVPLVEEAVEEMPHIQWLGRRPMAEVHEIMGKAQCLIFPSKWYETFGRVAVEAFAKGTPVVAAQIGAIAELVEDGKTGLYFQPGDAADLAQKVTAMFSDLSQQGDMQKAARQTFVERYTAPENYQQMMKIYESAITRS